MVEALVLSEPPDQSYDPRGGEGGRLLLGCINPRRQLKYSFGFHLPKIIGHGESDIGSRHEIANSTSCRGEDQIRHSTPSRSCMSEEMMPRGILSIDLNPTQAYVRCGSRLCFLAKSGLSASWQIRCTSATAHVLYCYLSSAPRRVDSPCPFVDSSRSGIKPLWLFKGSALKDMLRACFG